MTDELLAALRQSQAERVAELRAESERLRAERDRERDENRRLWIVNGMLRDAGGQLCGLTLTAETIFSEHKWVNHANDATDGVSDWTDRLTAADKLLNGIVPLTGGN